MLHFRNFSRMHWRSPALIIICYPKIRKYFYQINITWCSGIQSNTHINHLKSVQSNDDKKAACGFMAY